MKLGITMPTRTVELSRVAEYARMADEAGFDSIWDWEVYRNPLTMLAISAGVTRSATLGTGLAAVAGRSPFELANAAADVDELSGGRFVLGIGTGVKEFVEAFHSSDGRKPLTRMSEYIDVLRLSWQYLHFGAAASYEGEFYRFDPPKANVWGTRPMARPEIPIYLAAIGPQMTRLVGAKADGWLGYFQTPTEVRETILPLIADGARAAGRDPSSVVTTVEEICVIHEDRDLAYTRARRQVGFYVAHPSSDVMVTRAGLQDEVAALRADIRAHGLAAVDRLSDNVVDRFSLTGTPSEVRERVAAWEGAVDNLVLHTPYVPPFTAEESEECYLNIIDTFGAA